MQPYWYSRFFIKLWQKEAGRWFTDKIGVPIAAAMGNPFVQNKIEDIILGGCCLHYNNRAEFRAIVEDLAAKNVPQLIVMSDNDSVMTKEMNGEQLTLG